jgi:MFS family permease
MRLDHVLLACRAARARSTGSGGVALAVLATAQLLGRRATNLLGRRRMFMAALGLFGLASLVALLDGRPAA